MDGRKKHYLYATFSNLKSRCTNQNSPNWIYYGGRGISVCDRWRIGEGDKHPFECFLDDMGDRPIGHTIERIDNNGNYEPGNCCWATPQQQADNRRGWGTVRIYDSRQLEFVLICADRQVGH